MADRSDGGDRAFRSDPYFLRNAAVRGYMSTWREQSWREVMKLTVLYGILAMEQDGLVPSETSVERLKEAVQMKHAAIQEAKRVGPAVREVRKAQADIQAFGNDVGGGAVQDALQAGERALQAAAAAASVSGRRIGEAESKPAWNEGRGKRSVAKRPVPAGGGLTAVTVKGKPASDWRAGDPGGGSSLAKEAAPKPRSAAHDYPSWWAHPNEMRSALTTKEERKQRAKHLAKRSPPRLAYSVAQNEEGGERGALLSASVTKDLTRDLPRSKYADVKSSRYGIEDVTNRTPSSKNLGRDLSQGHAKTAPKFKTGNPSRWQPGKPVRSIIGEQIRAEKEYSKMKRDMEIESGRELLKHGGSSRTDVYGGIASRNVEGGPQAALQIAESFLSDPFFAANFSVSPDGQDFSALAGRRGVAQGDGRGARSAMDVPVESVPFTLGDPARYKPYSMAEDVGSFPREFGNVLDYEIRMAETSAAVAAEVQRDRLEQVEKLEFGDEDEQELRARANWVGEYGPAHTMSIREAIEARGNARNYKGVKPFEIVSSKDERKENALGESSECGAGAEASDPLEEAAKENPRSLAWTLDVEQTGASKARDVRSSGEVSRAEARKVALRSEEERAQAGSEFVQWGTDGPSMQEIAEHRHATQPQSGQPSPREESALSPRITYGHASSAAPGALAVSSLAPFLFSDPSAQAVQGSRFEFQRHDYAASSPSKPPPTGHFIFAEDFDAFRKLPSVTGMNGAHGIDSGEEVNDPEQGAAEDYW